MTGLLTALLLGVVQGITEFLPVSSSGHLVLFQEFVPIEGDEILFDLVLHVGTLLPALWFYRQDVATVARDATSGHTPWVQRPGVRLALLIVVATLPTALLGLAAKDFFESLFDNPGAVAVAFAATGVLLWATRSLGDGELDVRTTPWWMALVLGLAQGIAITPGISRSGATIATALLLGLEREFAVKLSFLMSVPAITGAVLLKSFDVTGASVDPVELGVGFVAAVVAGYAALVLLVHLVKVGRFADFRWYVWGAALFAAGVALWG